MTATDNNNNFDDIRKLPFLFCLSLVFYARAHFACDIIKFTVEMDEQQTNIAIRAVVRVLYFVEGRKKDFTMFFFFSVSSILSKMSNSKRVLLHSHQPIAYFLFITKTSQHTFRIRRASTLSLSPCLSVSVNVYK